MFFLEQQIESHSCSKKPVATTRLRIFLLRQVRRHRHRILVVNKNKPVVLQSPIFTILAAIGAAKNNTIMPLRLALASRPFTSEYWHIRHDRKGDVHRWVTSNQITWHQQRADYEGKFLIATVTHSSHKDKLPPTPVLRGSGFGRLVTSLLLPSPQTSNYFWVWGGSYLLSTLSPPLPPLLPEMKEKMQKQIK